MCRFRHTPLSFTKHILKGTGLRKTCGRAPRLICPERRACLCSRTEEERGSCVCSQCPSGPHTGPSGPTRGTLTVDECDVTERVGGISGGGLYSPARMPCPVSVTRTHARTHSHTQAAQTLTIKLLLCSNSNIEMHWYQNNRKFKEKCLVMPCCISGFYSCNANNGFTSTTSLPLLLH